MSMIFAAEPPAHDCQEVLEAAFTPRPAPMSIARCLCDRYFVLDERTGRWRRLPRWSRRVREAIAHNEERGPHGASR